MSRTLLVIISGPPGAGKTTLGKHIAAEFQQIDYQKLFEAINTIKKQTIK